MYYCDLSNFEEVFTFASEYNPYDEETVTQTIQCRGQLEKELFFDKLLGLLSIGRARDLYPPTSIEGLRNLHRKIVDSKAPEHHKQSLIYYLLQDNVKNDEEGAEHFAQACFLSDKFVIYMNGLWLMDHLKFQEALEHLSHPSLGIPTFADEILYHLVRRDKTEFTVPLAYYHTVNPPLANRDALNALFDCLCWVNIPEAFSFTRTQSDVVRRYLFEQLIRFVHSAIPTTRFSRRKELSEVERAKKAVELINLPFTDDEEHWFEEYLSDAHDSTLRDTKDTLMMRRIGTGRFTEALKDNDGLNHRKVEGVNWEALRPGIEKGLGSRKVLEEFLAP